jgi:hypothetical protein
VGGAANSVSMLAQLTARQEIVDTFQRHSFHERLPI